ncbi:segregation and condensation protein B [Lentzea atacamensis]|uniref:Segregation and condensation protein B n=1 Tax=Lentzea atacamensis TaxID=531938 RepID=A0ABX9E707_9PSEU|nr:SMC-Scp complex subunit ScpB [Lentzea atacamensis]RAS65479.1 segregation and condensation protein B [Lentzea atacamensis]
MSEPVVGPDAAEIENPGAAFDADGRVDDAAVVPEAAEPEPEPEVAGVPPVSGSSGGTDEIGTSEAEAVDNSGTGPEPAADPEAEPAADPEPAPAPEPEPGPESDSEPEPEADPDAATLEAQLLAAAPEEAIEDSGLPDLTDERELDAALESVLLVVDSPIAEDQLSSALEQPVKRIKEALRRLSSRYTESGSGIDLRRAGDGWRFYTRDRYAPFVEKLLLDGQRAKLTRAALETLAVIAYRQPVTRARVAAVRGVNVDGVIRTLVARGLIEETGTDSDTGGILYRTTELFLERLGLSSLHDLPPIAPLLPEVDAIDDV